MPARKWENQDEIQKNRVLKALKDNKKLDYLNIQQIARYASLDRNTVTKYLPTLEKEGKVVSLKVGRWHIYKMK